MGDLFLFITGPNLGHNQSPGSLAPRALTAEIKMDEACKCTQVVPRLSKDAWSFTSTFEYVFVTWRLIIRTDFLNITKIISLNIL